MVGWAPTSMRQALTVTIFSYAGQVVIGFGTDCAVVPDADALVTALDVEFRAAVDEVGIGTDAGQRSGSGSTAAEAAPKTTIHRTTG